MEGLEGGGEVRVEGRGGVVGGEEEVGADVGVDEAEDGEDGGEDCEKRGKGDEESGGVKMGDDGDSEEGCAEHEIDEAGADHDAS